MRQIGFPICDTEGRFSSSIDQRLPGTTAAQRALVQGRQPYHKGREAAHHPFAVLRDLNDTDKHREIRPVMGQEAGVFHAEVVEQAGFVVERVVPAADLLGIVRRYPGAQLCKVYGRVTGDLSPNVKMSFAGRQGIALDNGMWMIETFEMIETELTATFNEFETLI